MRLTGGTHNSLDRHPASELGVRRNSAPWNLIHGTPLRVPVHGPMSSRVFLIGTNIIRSWSRYQSQPRNSAGASTTSHLVFSDGWSQWEPLIASALQMTKPSATLGGHVTNFRDASSPLLLSSSPWLLPDRNLTVI
jgi:hypothetical protein